MRRFAETLWTLLGIAVWLAAGLCLTLIASPRLGPSVALGLAASAFVLLPVALAGFLHKALKRIDPSSSFTGNALGLSVLCALLSLVSVASFARERLAQGLLHASQRFTESPEPVRRAARSLGARLRETPTDAGTQRALDAPRDTEAFTPRDVLADMEVLPPSDAALDASPPTPSDASPPTLSDASSAMDTEALSTDATLISPGPDVDASVEPTFLGAVEVCPSIRAVYAFGVGDRDELVVDCNDGVHVLWFEPVTGLLLERTRFVFHAPAGLLEATSASRLSDMDADGHPDVLLCALWMSQRGGTRGGGLWWSRGVDRGRFERPQRVIPELSCGAVEVGDITRDGRPELLVADYGNPYLASHPGGSLRWYARINRQWAPRGRVDLLPMPRSLWLADANGDGRLDVMVDHDDDGEVVVPSLGTGLGAIDRGLSVLPEPDRTRCSFDLDGDGSPDRAHGDQSYLRLFATRATRAPTAVTRAPDFIEYTP